ncbi:HNH endonuclease [Stackebrandtia albiflava]
MEAAKAGVHRNPQMGIVGGKDGAESVVLAGEYADKDQGDLIIYTGEGGHDSKAKKRIGDQQLTKGNLGLSQNVTTGQPVRVIRGAKAKTRYSPKDGYRYSGLYRVADFWRDQGKEEDSGFVTWRFRLEAIGEIALDAAPEDQAAAAEISSPVGRMERKVRVQIRRVALAQKVKELYDYQCQVCNVQLKTPTGKYAEAAHIRGLGEPHNGPDRLENLLCLCPNHHVLFDRGAISVDPNGKVIDTRTDVCIGELSVDASHHIIPEYIQYHATHVAVAREAWKHQG